MAYILKDAYNELEALVDSEYSVKERKEEILNIIKKLDAKGSTPLPFNLHFWIYTPAVQSPLL